MDHSLCRKGIPNTIVSDNGPQFVSGRFKKFLERWDIGHVTSSPRYPQSNGKAERAVHTVKGLMNKNLNLNAALCAYRDTPVSGKFSPAQLLLNRSLNSMEIHKDIRVDLDQFKSLEENRRAAQALQYSRRQGTTKGTIKTRPKSNSQQFGAFTKVREDCRH